MDVVFVALAVVFWLLMVGSRRGLRKARRAQAMSWLYVLGSIVSVGLLVYLIGALLFPEKLS